MTRLVITSFNIWMSGGRSLADTATIIGRLARDGGVVGLQECKPEIADHLAAELDLHAAVDANHHAILSPWPIESLGATDSAWGGMGVTVEHPTIGPVHVFDAHLHWQDYGPYFLGQGKTAEFVCAREEAMRMDGLREVLASMKPAIASGAPTFLVGDFNAPSHLDYDDVAWPTSKACEAAGLVDAWRVVHPVVPPRPFTIDSPGITWSPLASEEPHGAYDRIDFVYLARNPRVAAVAAETLDDAFFASWPSDHRAVCVTFEVEDAS